MVLMDLGHELADALVELQEADESRMTEHFIIDRPTGTEFDDEGREQTTYVPVYDGIGRVPPYWPHPQAMDAAGSTITLERAIWRIPAPERMALLMDEGRVSVWSGPVRPGDRARVMDGETVIDTVRIDGHRRATDQTAQRLLVDEITGGVWS